MAARKVIMFAGPTLARATRISQKVDLGGIVILPPVKRGDVPRVIQAPEPGVLVIVDGFFHLENLSVGHLEIRLAMKRRWEVWGLSSMGAIRAAEMHHMGVRGWGAVFERYRDDPDFRDDEVALLHEPGPPYREGTEPLVHMRAGLADLVAQGLIAEADSAAILDELMGIWFGERTLPKLREMVTARQPARSEEIQAWFKGFDQFRLKAHDLLSFLAQRPWLQSTHAAG